MTEQNRQKKHGRFRQFLSQWWGWLVVALILFVSIVVPVVLVWTGRLPTGFGDYTDPAGEFQRGKTLWDWMDLLLAPAVIGIFGALFSWALGRRQREAHERQVREQREIEERRSNEKRSAEQDRSREAALQTYLDRMTELIKEGLCRSELEDEKRIVARARTLTILRQLGGERKGILLQFLYEAGLIAIPSKGKDHQGVAIVNLLEADLSGACLPDANLGGAYLSGVDLHQADLRGADLHEADLRGAALQEANLSRTYMRGVDLRGAHLHATMLREAFLNDALLSVADLSGADFSGADLNGASLRRADLSGANLTPKQLQQAKTLEGATLPDGTVHE